jgi:hypothetical protein
MKKTDKLGPSPCGDLRVIPDSEWKFFEGTEQRLKHLARHRAENLVALLRHEALPWDPAQLDERQTLSLQELDYPARIEAAFLLEPTPEQERHLVLHRRWALQALFQSHPDLAPLGHDLQTRWAALCPDSERPWAEVALAMRSSPDRDRREEAWKALAALALPFREDVAELLGRRELLSRTLFQTGFPVIAFHFHELDRSEIIGLIDILERFTRRTFEDTRREIASALDVHDLEPWDLDVGFEKLGELPTAAIPDAAKAIHEEARRWGFDPSQFPRIVETPDLIVDAWPVWVDAPRDMRVLVRPGSDWTTLRAQVRAFGAALHGAHGRSRRHFLEQDSAVMREATGRIFEGLLDDPAWLREHTGADASAVKQHLYLARRRRILELRRDAALTAFENLAYAPSKLDPQRLYADVMEHMLQETRRPEAVWASQPDLVFRPFAQGAALVGAMIGAQTRRALAGIDPGRRADWLVEHYLGPGAREPIASRVERATGAPPGMEALAEELGVEPEGPALAEETQDDALTEYFKDIDLSDLDD